MPTQRENLSFSKKGKSIQQDPTVSVQMLSKCLCLGASKECGFRRNMGWNPEFQGKALNSGKLERQQWNSSEYFPLRASYRAGFLRFLYSHSAWSFSYRHSICVSPEPLYWGKFWNGVHYVYYNHGNFIHTWYGTCLVAAEQWSECCYLKNSPNWIPSSKTFFSVGNNPFLLISLTQH